MSFLITLEGIEGCGKTTQARLLSEALRQRGLAVVTTREPGGCAIADAIRAILLDSANRALVPDAELLLYAAARAQHVAEVVRPALTSGQLVVCDRFTDATLAYQGFGRGLDLTLIDRLNDIACAGVQPEITLLFDLEPTIGLRRALERMGQISGPCEARFEQEDLDFHQRVRDGYLRLAARHPRRIKVIAATGGVDEVAARVRAAMDEFLGQRGLA